MKAKLVTYNYLCINRSGSIRTDSLQVVQTQRLSDKHKRIPKEHNTDHQVRTTLHESTGSVDEISTTIINAKYPIKQLLTGYPIARILARKFVQNT